MCLSYAHYLFTGNTELLSRTFCRVVDCRTPVPLSFPRKTQFLRNIHLSLGRHSQFSFLGKRPHQCLHLSTCLATFGSPLAFPITPGWSCGALISAPLSPVACRNGRLSLCRVVQLLVVCSPSAVSGGSHLARTLLQILNNVIKLQTFHAMFASCVGVTSLGVCDIRLS